MRYSRSWCTAGPHQDISTLVEAKLDHLLAEGGGKVKVVPLLINVIGPKLRFHPAACDVVVNSSHHCCRAACFVFGVTTIEKCDRPEPEHVFATAPRLY